jgi:hypothetical protein
MISAFSCSDKTEKSPCIDLGGFVSSAFNADRFAREWLGISHAI